MPTSYMPVKRRAYSVRRSPRRRRNSTTLAIHRGPRGIWVSDRGSSKRVTVLKTGKVRRRRRSKARKAPARRRATRRAPARRKRRAARKSNPPRHHRRRRHSRRHARRSNPGHRRHRRRRHARRSNPPRYHRRHHRRRRNPGFSGILGKSLSLLGKTAGLAAGFGIGLYVPKLLGTYVHSSLQRGWGGVGTSIAASLTSGWLVGKVNYQAGNLVKMGGLLASFLMAISAVSASTRTMVFPIEEALLAASLPTMAPAGAPTSAAASAMIAQLVAGGVSPAQAQQIAAATGMADYLRRGQLGDYYSPPKARIGMSDYYVPNAGSKNSDYFTKGEQF